MRLLVLRGKLSGWSGTVVDENLDLGPVAIDEDAAGPEGLAEQLHQYYLNDLVADQEGVPVSFTQLLMGEQYNLNDPAFAPGFVPVAPVVQQVATMGDLSVPVERVDAAEFTRRKFANNGALYWTPQ